MRSTCYQEHTKTNMSFYITDVAKLIYKKWTEELQIEPLSKTKESNDQLASKTKECIS